MNNVINYGIGKEYLSHWGIQEALREIYQNFIDYGEYTEKTREWLKPDGTKVIGVTLENSYAPTDFSFLRIGNSVKHNNTSIGKYGEGLKMAFLILLREQSSMKIFTKNFGITPQWSTNNHIGDTLNLVLYSSPRFYTDTFKVSLIIPVEEYKKFKENLIEDFDIIYSNYHGDIVAKDKGNIYSGNLFVTNVKNLTQAYNIKPEHLSLDRDRKTPTTFDVNYHTSKIKEGYNKTKVEDLTYSDTLFATQLPDTEYSKISTVVVGNSIEFTIKNPETQEDIIIQNNNIKEHLKSSNFFKDTISKLKSFIAKTLGIDEMLKSFRDKHCTTKEAKEDFDMILLKLNINIDK